MRISDWSSDVCSSDLLYGTFQTGSISHNFAIGGELSWEKAERGTLAVTDGRTTPRCTPLAISRFYCTSLFNPNPNDPWVNYSSETDGVPTDIARGGSETRTTNHASTKALYAFDSITRSEEHTSELQSLMRISYADFCLQKKKKNN